jgi:hypothetical protein
MREPPETGSAIEGEAQGFGFLEPSDFEPAVSRPGMQLRDSRHVATHRIVLPANTNIPVRTLL